MSQHRAAVLAVFSFSLAVLSAGPAVAQAPVLYFSDLTSGPATGNTDSSGGRVAGRDGAIVTVWGRNFGSSLLGVRIFCGGVEASSTYSLSDATAPANLSTFHRMQRLSFQVGSSARAGLGEITVAVGGQSSNPLPFTVRGGAIRFVKTTGDDAAGNGTWTSPWRTIPKAVESLAPGDIAYVGDGVDQAVEYDFGAAVNLGTNGEPGRPKALVVYPGARSRVGSETLGRAFHSYDAIQDRASSHWVVAGFTITTGEVGVSGQTGFRIVGNFVTAPRGDGLDGAIGVLGDDVAVLGNELFDVGSPQCGKLYHAIYVSGIRRDAAPRAATEQSREIGWNYIHDGHSNRAINLYSEQPNSAFLAGHRIHDNVILNQHGDGILVGYYVTGENWITNNLIVYAGLGPEWPDDSSSHTGLRVDSGHEASPGTVVHVHHNTIYGCGWSGAVSPGENGHLLISPEALARGVTLDFRNNIVVSTGEPLLAPESGAVPAGDYRNCWSGGGGAPAWDRLALSAVPGFVDSSALNFELLSSSACVDAAVAVAAPVARDLLGVPRPQGQASDLGAYELVAGGGGGPCTLSCSATAPVTGIAGEVLAFVASASPSNCGGGAPAAAWTFGDGGTAAGFTAAHAYAAPGTYSWTMTASVAGVTCARSGGLTITAAPAAGAFVYTIPAVTHSPGSAGAVFRTDVAAVSLSDAAASLTLTFSQTGGGSLDRSATIPPRGAREFADVLVSLFGNAPDAAVFGALQIASTVPLVVSSRTYNQTANGTLGGFLPGVAGAQGLVPGRIGILPQLKKSAAFRTNVAVVNLGASPVTGRTQLRDGSGAPLGAARTWQAAPFRLVQENDIFSAAGVSEAAVAYATVEVLTAGGRVFAFASVIDNATNDPTLVSLVVPEN